VPGIDPLQAPARMGEGISITVYDGNMIPQSQPLKSWSSPSARRGDTPPVSVCGPRGHGRGSHTHLPHRGPDHRHRSSHPSLHPT
jgi:hypothetical protein